MKLKVVKNPTLQQSGNRLLCFANLQAQSPHLPAQKGRRIEEDGLHIVKRIAHFGA
jgi:hypothetical protein